MGLIIKLKCEQEKIDKAEQKLLLEFNKKFPDVSYTTFITKWNDGTFKIEIRHGEPSSEQNEFLLHHYTWYNGEIEYKTSIVNK